MKNRRADEDFLTRITSIFLKGQPPMRSQQLQWNRRGRAIGGVSGACSRGCRLAPATAFQYAQYPGGLGQDRGFGFGGKQAPLGQGDRVPKMEAGITKPAADGSAQLFITATIPEGAILTPSRSPKVRRFAARLRSSPRPR